MDFCVILWHSRDVTMSDKKAPRKVPDKKSDRLSKKQFKKWRQENDAKVDTINSKVDRMVYTGPVTEFKVDHTVPT